tara:strand:- start:316 stop:450 length:135 start_codon:yes stop_codon:yes gene_type:complete
MVEVMLPLDMDCLMAYYLERVFSDAITGRSGVHDIIAPEIEKLN